MMMNRLYVTQNATELNSFGHHILCLDVQNVYT